MRDNKGRFIKGHKQKWTKERRLKVSESLKGKNTWSKGRKLTESHKAKIKRNNAKYWLGKERPEMIGNQFAFGHEPNKTSFKKGNVPKTLGKINHAHPKWKDIKQNPLHQSIRQLFQYGKWRLAILKRDDNKCVLCGSDKYVEVDHYPKDFYELVSGINTIEEAISSKELWDINNGRALCVKCHQKTPNYFWKSTKKKH